MPAVSTPPADYRLKVDGWGGTRIQLDPYLGEGFGGARRMGSRNEQVNQSGFAHLYEHLMFSGSENYGGEWMKTLNEAGATTINGVTDRDKTYYFETVPTPALERALWMESDRMGHLMGVITQAKLDQQRGIVQNEKREAENHPLRNILNTICEGLLPAEHPYHHSTIGSMSDLNSASLDQVRKWFREYYGPNSAVIVLSGDVAPATARAKVEEYFGDIPPGPSVDRWKAWVPTRTHDTREIRYFDASSAFVSRNWPAPPGGHRIVPCSTSLRP